MDEQILTLFKKVPLEEDGLAFLTISNSAWKLATNLSASKLILPMTVWTLPVSSFLKLILPFFNSSTVLAGLAVTVSFFGEGIKPRVPKILAIRAKFFI